MKKSLLLLSAITFGALAWSCGSTTSTEQTTATDTVATSGAATANLTKTMNVDTAQSRINWKGEMLRMYSHEGYVKFNEGNVSITNGAVTGGRFVANMTNIVPTDNGYDAENPREKLVQHLASPDFFATAQNPTATFEITGTEGSAVTGNLTVRGKTNAERVENVRITEENGLTVLTGDLTFDRTKYDVKFSMPVGEKVLSNNIQLNIRLVEQK